MMNRTEQREPLAFGLGVGWIALGIWGLVEHSVGGWVFLAVGVLILLAWAMRWKVIR